MKLGAALLLAALLSGCVTKEVADAAKRARASSASLRRGWDALAPELAPLTSGAAALKATLSERFATHEELLQVLVEVAEK